MADVEISSSGQKLYMRHKLRMSRYGGTLGGGHLPWALSLVLVGGSGWRISRYDASHVWRWRFEDRCLVVCSSVTLVLDTSMLH